MKESTRTFHCHICSSLATEPIEPRRRFSWANKGATICAECRGRLVEIEKLAAAHIKDCGHPEAGVFAWAEENAANVPGMQTVECPLCLSRGIYGFGFSELRRHLYRCKIPAAIGEQFLAREFRRGEQHALDETEQKYLERTARRGHVYLILNVALHQVKIGKAKNVTRRLKGLQTSTGADLALLASFEADDATAAERSLHEKFAAHHINREWFAMHPDILAHFGVAA